MQLEEASLSNFSHCVTLFLMNLFALNLCFPIALVLGIFCIPPDFMVHAIFFKAKLLYIFTLCWLLLIPFSHSLFNKLIFFTLLGMWRAEYINNAPEVYSYKRTSFSADITDIKIREHGTYLELENLQYCPMSATKSEFNIKKDKKTEYTLDETPTLPKKAQMLVNEHHDITGKLLKKGKFIGRFLLPMPSALPEQRNRNITRGLIDEMIILETKEHTFKSTLREKFSQNLSKQPAQLAKAVFLGDTFAIDQNLRNTFQCAGIAHLLGVSVLNVAMLGAIFYFLARRLIGLFFFKLALYVPLDIIGKIASILMICAYCYAVGFEYPLLRSLLLSTFALFGLYFGRQRNLEILLWSGALILLVNPDAIFNIGFQLSFAAVLGLCASVNLKTIRGSSIIRKILRYFSKAIYSTFFASMAILPLSIYHFQTVSMQPFLANIVAIPFMTLIITPISLLWFLASLFGHEYLLSGLLDFSLHGLVKIADTLAPLGLNIHINPIFPYGCIIFMICLAFFGIFKERIRYVFLLFGIACFMASILLAPKRPFLLVHPYAIGLVFDEQIVVYPKCNFIGRIWMSAYNLPCIDGKNSPYFSKDTAGRLIVLNKTALLFNDPKTETIDSKIPTYVIPYSEQMQKVKRITL